MAYEKINWENVPSTNTPINAENLDHMDNGIANAHELIGKIVETGSNEDGQWIKFDNGIMICTKINTTTVTCNKEWGSVYESEQIDLGKMAQPFIEIPTILTGNIGRTGIIEGFQQITNENFGYTWLMRPVLDTHEAEYNLHLTAIGKYKLNEYEEQ